jgi:hypothetical protein
MSQVPALLRSKTTASDTISIQLIRPKVAYMFEEDFERGSGPVFEDEDTAKECAGEGIKVVKVNITKA